MTSAFILNVHFEIVLKFLSQEIVQVIVLHYMHNGVTLLPGLAKGLLFFGLYDRGQSFIG